MLLEAARLPVARQELLRYANPASGDTLMAARYRVRQFLRMAGILGPSRAGVLRWEITSLLSPAERAIFSRLSDADQRHSVELATRLWRDGHDDSLLLRAALLHDVGKAEAGVRLWHRVVVVLVNRFAPRLRGWLTATSVGWRQPFFVIWHHPSIGAERLRQLGTPVEVIWLVRHHEHPGDHPSGQLLRAYDSTD